MHTHRASATGWRGKRETRPQHSSVFISAPPEGLNCAWSCARINQNLGESWSTAKHQGDTTLWGRAQIGEETHRPEPSAGSRRASEIHFSCVAEAQWNGTFWHLGVPYLSRTRGGEEGQTASRPPWPLRDFELPLEVFRNVHLCHRESCAGPSSPG